MLRSDCDRGRGKKLVWEREDLDFILSNYMDMSLEDMGRRLSVSPPTVSKKLKELGVRKPKYKGCHVWTDYELDYIRSHYADSPLIDVADHLNLSPSLVKKKSIELGLKKSPHYTTRAYHNRYIRNYKHLEA